VTVFSVVGIAAGVGTLVVALAMNTGFRRTIQDRLLGVSAHVNLTRPGEEGIPDYRALAERLSHVNDVRSIAPAIYLTVLLSAEGHARGVVIKGIDPALEMRTDEALHRIASGSANLEPDADGFDSLVVGKIMAEELGIRAGDFVTLTSPQGKLTALRDGAQVTPIFTSQVFSIPAFMIMTPTGHLQHWLRRRAWREWAT